MPMGRPRRTRTDLPDGLHYRADRGTYFYRPTRGPERRYVELGRITREQAIRQWVKLTTKPEHAAADGTVGEIIDQYIREELPRRVRLEKMAKSTEYEYTGRRRRCTRSSERRKCPDASRIGPPRRSTHGRWGKVPPSVRGRQGRGYGEPNSGHALVGVRLCQSRRYLHLQSVCRRRAQSRIRAQNILSADVRGKLLAAITQGPRPIAAFADVTALRRRPPGC